MKTIVNYTEKLLKSSCRHIWHVAKNIPTCKASLARVQITIILSPCATGLIGSNEGKAASKRSVTLQTETSGRLE